MLVACRDYTKIDRAGGAAPAVPARYAAWWNG
jgi:hypothetical protein